MMRYIFIAVLFVIPIMSCVVDDRCDYYKTAILSFETEFDTTDNNDNDDDAFFGFPWYQSGIDRRSDAFSQVCQHPERYLKCFQEIIIDKDINYRKKHIALYSMRLMPIERYATVVNLLNTAFKDGLINEQTLETAITQDGIWNNTTLIYFLNPEFQKVYKQVLNNPKLSKKVIDSLRRFESLDEREKMLESFRHNREI